MKKQSLVTVPKADRHTGEATSGAVPFRSPRPPLRRIDALHQTAGNQVVQRLFQSGAIQPKLSVSKTNDVYEQEAERMEKQVLAGPEHPTALQGNPGIPVVQRKIKANTRIMQNNSLDYYLGLKGIRAYSKTGNVYSRGWASTTGLEKQILFDMLASDRIFSVAGVLPSTARKNLDRHVKARKGVVDYTKKKAFGWGVGPSVKMNPLYWRSAGGRIAPQIGVTMLEAAQDVFNNPWRYPYAMACHAATGITMVAGSGTAQYKEPTGVKEHDWVPGDWGYLDNPGYVEGKSKLGRSGQNMIYVGDGKYWGHPAGVKTMSGWKRHVWLWDKAVAKLKDWRRYPDVGLE